MTTQHEKTLVIAKAMYGEKKVHDCCDVDNNNYIEVDSLPFERFNPYINAWHNQAVQKFFKIATHPTSFDKWEAKQILNPASVTVNKDLKTAIADCAYLVCKEK